MVKPETRRARRNGETADCQPLTANRLTLHRARRQAGDNLFLGEQVESDGWDHCKANES
jgi:hypothetical protein